MALLSRKILENRRRQHVLVTAHKRRIRDEVRPQLMQVKRAWSESSRENNRKIKERWHIQKAKVGGMQRDQKILHKSKILAHKRRIRAELANRR
jgi:hypothetical protein